MSVRWLLGPAPSSVTSAVNRRRSFAAVAVLLGLALANPTSAENTPAPPSLTEVAEAYGFTSDDVEAMLSGEAVLGDLRAVSDNELALSAMFLTNKPLSWHLDRIEAARSVDPTLEGMGFFGDDPMADLAPLELGDDELDRIAKAEVGDDFNLTKSEVERIRAAAKAEGKAARRRDVLNAFKAVLADRVARYRRGGLSSIEAYDRGDGDRSQPANQLARALEQLRVTTELAPRVVEALRAFPEMPHPEIPSRLAWARNDAEGRVLVSLTHRVSGQSGASAVAIEHRFFIHHTLTSMQAAAVAFPVEEGTVVLYANRTGTDLVTGFGSSIAKKIGTALMRREVKHLVDTFLEATDSAVSAR